MNCTNHTFRHLIYLLVFFVFATGCSEEEPMPSVQSELDKSRELWEAQTVVHYTYTYENSGFTIYFGSSFSVEVIQNQVVEVTNIERNLPVQNVLDGFYPTIEELFDRIQNAINNNAAKIEVDYDINLGYPSRIFIDWDESIADEEDYLNVSNVVVLN